MEESLRTARAAHQFLLGLSGIYLLGHLTADPCTEVVSEINFLGIKLANDAILTVVMGAAFLVATLRLCVFLGHIRRLPKSNEDVYLVKTFPWVLLLGETNKLAHVLGWIETIALLAVGSEIGRMFCQTTPWVGIPYLAVLMGLLIYGFLQLHHIREDARRWIWT